MFPRPEVLIPPGPDYALRIKHIYSRGWHQDYFLSGDEHIDSHECYLKLLIKHLEDAKERGALWISNGDMLDVINSVVDPRGSKGGTIAEVATSTYLDDVVDYVFGLLMPYADIVTQIGTGNHEAKVISRKEVDLIRHLVDKLNSVRSSGLPPIHRVGYTSWIRFMFENAREAGRSSEFMKLEHGTGGNSPVTKGVIQAQRRQVRTQLATFFVSSHIHEKWTQNFVSERPNLSTGKIELHRAAHIQLGSYKSDFRQDGTATWSMEKHGDPRPLGGMFLRFYCKDGETVHWRLDEPEIDYPNLQNYLRRPARISRVLAQAS